MPLNTAYSEENPVIPQARSLTRICVEEVVEASDNLHELIANQHSLVLHLTRGLLSEYIIRRQIKAVMVERWVMEALCQFPSETSHPKDS